MQKDYVNSLFGWKTGAADPVMTYKQFLDSLKNLTREIGDNPRINTQYKKPVLDYINNKIEQVVIPQTELNTIQTWNNAIEQDKKINQPNTANPVTTQASNMEKFIQYSIDVNNYFNQITPYLESFIQQMKECNFNRWDFEELKIQPLVKTRLKNYGAKAIILRAAAWMFLYRTCANTWLTTLPLKLKMYMARAMCLAAYRQHLLICYSSCGCSFLRLLPR